MAKQTTVQKALAKIEAEIQVLEQVRARLIEQMQDKIARKPRAIKSPPKEQSA